MRVLVDGLDTVIEGEVSGGELLDGVSGQYDLEAAFTVQCDDWACFLVHGWLGYCGTLKDLLRCLTIGRWPLAAFIAMIVMAACAKDSFAVSPFTTIDQYGHKAWRPGQDGLDGSPLSVAQTADGFIWVGTAHGLFRFDGVHFTSWSPHGGEQLRSSYIFELFGGRDGSLYVGTDAGLSRITNGQVYNYADSPDWAGSFTEDADGALWMGDYATGTNFKTLCKIGENTLSCLGTRDGLDCTYATAVMSERAGSFWVADGHGICHWQKNKKPENFPLRYLPRTSMGSIYMGAAQEREIYVR